MKLQQEIKQPYKAAIIVSFIIGFLVLLLVTYNTSGLIGCVYSSSGGDIRLLPMQEWGIDITPSECQDMHMRSKYVFIELADGKEGS